MIYVYLADGFEEIEALATVDVLRRAHLDAATAGVGARQVTGSHNITVKCDVLAEDAPLDGVSMIVLPGGIPGAANLEKSPAVQKAVKYCSANGIYIAAICAAPSILGHMGLLDGQKFTCFPGFESSAPGGCYTAGRVEVSGRIITGRGAGAAVEFALKLVSIFKGDEESRKLGESMQCPT